MGINARGIPVADFDSDGKLPTSRLPMRSETTWKLYLGNGNGTFRAGPTSAAMSNVNWDVAADLNGDGKTDLALVSTSVAGILLGNGNGTFKPIQTFSVDSGTVWLTLADVNNDGVLDAIAAGAPATDVFLGNGNGTFKPKIAVGTFAGTRVDATDLNGDGRIDLVVNENTAVALGNGDGTFKPPVAIPNTGTAPGFAVGDYTGDAIPDLIVFSSGTKLQFVARQRATAPSSQAGPRAPTSEATGRAIRSPPATSTATASSMSILGHDSFVGVLLGNGNGTFQPETTFSVGRRRQNFVYGFTLADVNSDGRLALVAGDPNTSQTVSVLLNKSNGDFTGTVTTTVDQTLPVPSTILSARWPSPSIRPAAFSFSGADPTAGGISSGVNHIEVSLDGSAFAAATSPVSYGALGNGSHVFRVRSVDNAGNVGTAAAYSWTNDTTSPPAVLAIAHSAPTATATNADSVVYSVTFNGIVTGVDPSDFTVPTTGTVTIGSPLVVSGSDNIYAVTVSGILGDGTLALRLVDDDSIIAVSNGKPLGGIGAGNGSFLGDAYTIDHTAPTATFTSQPAAAVTQTTSATFAFAGDDPRSAAS